jgi:hypothetical protein
MRVLALRQLSVIAATALLLGATGDGLAQPTTVPSGLSPGDKYRLAFVTSTTRDATSSDIADYNAFVTAVANTVPALTELGTTWTAIGSTAAVDARDNTNTNPGNAEGVPIYLLDGTLLVRAVARRLLTNEQWRIVF